MSESSEPLLLLENSGLDMNENMPFAQNCSFLNVEPLVDTVSSSICPKSDSTFVENFNSITSESSIKVSETCSEMPLIFDETFINNDVNASNQNTDISIHDSENNVFENEIHKINSDELNFNENCVMVSDFNNEENTSEFKEEEFHDAVQFFKDPLSLALLEKAGSSSVPTNSSIVRSSLYQKFDPLHAKFFSQSNTKSNELQLQEVAEDEIDLNHCNAESALESDTVQNEVETNKLLDDTNNVLNEVTTDEHENNIPHDIHINDSVPEIVNKHLSNTSPRQSFGNVLISFDSPVTVNKDIDSCVPDPQTQKMYSEEEFQQALKIQELTIQENFLKKQQELEAKLDQQKCLSNSLYAVLKEAINLTYILSDKNTQMKDKLAMAEEEISKLKEDLKTSVEDIQSVETTFSDFHKRYEQCKNMLKVYTENEKCLKQQLENMTMQRNEKEEMYKALQSRTEDMLDKANLEVANAKKAGEAQVAVLKAQLKKAELKISSLESDVKHVKIENGKLSSICDDLMAKVSET